MPLKQQEHKILNKENALKLMYEHIKSLAKADNTIITEEEKLKIIKQNEKIINIFESVSSYTETTPEEILIILKRAILSIFSKYILYDINSKTQKTQNFTNIDYTTNNERTSNELNQLFQKFNKINNITKNDIKFYTNSNKNKQYKSQTLSVELSNEYATNTKLEDILKDMATIAYHIMPLEEEIKKSKQLKLKKTIAAQQKNIKISFGIGIAGTILSIITIAIILLTPPISILATTISIAALTLGALTFCTIAGIGFIKYNQIKIKEKKYITKNTELETKENNHYATLAPYSNKILLPTTKYKEDILEKFQHETNQIDTSNKQILAHNNIEKNYKKIITNPLDKSPQINIKDSKSTMINQQTKLKNIKN